MTRPVLLLCALLAACAPAAPSLDLVVSPAHGDTPVLPTDLVADVAEAAVPSVVHLAVRRAAPEVPPGMMPFFGPMPRGGQGGTGSGVIVDAKGLILTNHHVVDGAETVRVTLADGRQLDGRVRGSDPATDLAVVELVGDVPTDLRAMPFGDSERLRLGQSVMAIGAPFGLRGSVSMGIVSAVGRANMGLTDYEDFIQTDAAINPGNSGGALLTLDGRLAGVNTAIHSLSGGYQGIGFAIPSNMAQQIFQRLVSEGKVVRGYLGVGIQDLDADAAPMFGLSGSAHGALVNHVQPDTPSARAGLTVGDVITAVDGAPVKDAAHLRQAIAMKGRGVDVSLSLLRAGQPATVRAHLDGLPTNDRAGNGHSPDRPGQATSGLSLRPLDDALRGRLGVPAEVRQGLVVTEVAPGSVAEQQGLSPGDLIVEINRAPAGGAADLAAALGKGDALLLVRRGPAARFLVLPRSR